VVPLRVWGRFFFLSWTRRGKKAIPTRLAGLADGSGPIAGLLSRFGLATSTEQPWWRSVLGRRGFNIDTSGAEQFFIQPRLFYGLSGRAAMLDSRVKHGTARVYLWNTLYDSLGRLGKSVFPIGCGTVVSRFDAGETKWYCNRFPPPGALTAR